FGPTSRPLRIAYYFNLYSPVETPQPLSAALHQALDEADLGSASLVGSNSIYSARQQLQERLYVIAVTLRGDQERGLDLVRSVLRQNTVPAGTRLRQATAPYANIPLLLGPVG